MYAGTEQRNRERVQVLADQLYRDHRGRLLAIATRNAANREDASEAVQFAFLAFIEHFDPDAGALPLAWLTTTVKRQCWAAYRLRHLDRSAGQEAAPGEEGPGVVIDAIPSRAAESAQLLERVDEARRQLAALKPDERTAIGLKAAGYSYREIGEGKGWTYTKVNRCLSEGRAALRAGG